MKKLLFVLAVLAVLAAPLGAGNPTVVEIALWPRVFDRINFHGTEIF